jgi:predicted Zn-dependent peptidase
MSKVETLIQEIRALDPEDLQKVLQELLKQADRLQLTKDSLGKFAGSGKGVWGIDAQEYTDQLRKIDRL